MSRIRIHIAFLADVYSKLVFNAKSWEDLHQRIDEAGVPNFMNYGMRLPINTDHEPIIPIGSPLNAVYAYAAVVRSGALAHATIIYYLEAVRFAKEVVDMLPTRYFDVYDLAEAYVKKVEAEQGERDMRMLGCTYKDALRQAQENANKFNRTYYVFYDTAGCLNVESHMPSSTIKKLRNEYVLVHPEPKGEHSNA